MLRVANLSLCEIFHMGVSSAPHCARSTLTGRGFTNPSITSAEFDNHGYVSRFIARHPDTRRLVRGTVFQPKNATAAIFVD